VFRYKTCYLTVTKKLYHIIKTLMSHNITFMHPKKQFSLKDFFLSIISDCGFRTSTITIKEKIKSWVNNTDEFESHKIKLLNKFVASVCVMAIISGITVLFSESAKSAIIPICYIPIFLLSSYFIYIGRVKLAFSYFVLSQFTTITFFIFIVHSSLGLNYYYLITPIIAYIFLEDRPVLRIVIIVSSIALFVLSQYVYANYEPLILSKHLSFSQTLNFITYFTIVYFLMRFYLAELKIYRKKINEVLNELNTKNASLENFNRVAAHDLKQPLSSIEGFASLVKNRLSKKDCAGDLEMEALLHIKDASKFYGSIISKSYC